MEVALCICHPQHRLAQKEQSREVSWKCLSKPGDVPGSPSQPVWVQQRDACENLDWIFVFHSGSPPPFFVNSSFQFSASQGRKLQVRLDN